MGADSFKRLLGSSELSSIIIGAVAAKELVVANGAFLCITPHDVQLTFEHAAVMAGLGVGSPVVAFGAVGDSRKLAAGARVGPDLLRFADPIWPALDHSDAAVLDEATGHGPILVAAA